VHPRKRRNGDAFPTRSKRARFGLVPTMPPHQDRIVAASPQIVSSLGAVRKENVGVLSAATDCHPEGRRRGAAGLCRDGTPGRHRCRDRVRHSAPPTTAYCWCICNCDQVQGLRKGEAHAGQPAHDAAPRLEPWSALYAVVLALRCCRVTSTRCWRKKSAISSSSCMNRSHSSRRSVMPTSSAAA
jgi:hypothetical protein